MSVDKKVMGGEVGNEVALPKVSTFRNRFGSRYSDLTDDDDDDVLADRLGADLDDYDQVKQSQSDLNALLTKDADAANILAGLATGRNSDGSPFSLIEYLAEFHDEELAGYLGSEDYTKKLAEKKAAREAEAAEEAQFASLSAENLEASDKALEGLITSGEVSESQVRDLLDWLYAPDGGLVERLLMNDVREEDWRKLLQMKDFDSSINAARQSGYKEGRNEQINMHKHKRADMAQLPPDIVGGGLPDDKPVHGDSTLSALSRMGKSKFKD